MTRTILQLCHWIVACIRCSLGPHFTISLLPMTATDRQIHVLRDSPSILFDFLCFRSSHTRKPWHRLEFFISHIAQRPYVNDIGCHGHYQKSHCKDVALFLRSHFLSSHVITWMVCDLTLWLVSNLSTPAVYQSIGIWAWSIHVDIPSIGLLGRVMTDVLHQAYHHTDWRDSCVRLYWLRTLRILNRGNFIKETVMSYEFVLCANTCVD